MSNPEDVKKLVTAISCFLQQQATHREDFTAEDRESIQVAVECLESTYGIGNSDHHSIRSSRPLLDMFQQLHDPVNIKDKLRADSYKSEGNQKMLAHEHGEAEELYTRAIELDNWNAIYYCNRAAARIHQQNYVAALTDCRHAINLNPDYAKAYNYMGLAHGCLNRPRRAVYYFQKACDLDPSNETFRSNLRAAESQMNQTLNSNIQDIFSLLSGFLGGGLSPSHNHTMHFATILNLRNARSEDTEDDGFSRETDSDLECPFTESSTAPSEVVPELSACSASEILSSESNEGSLDSGTSSELSPDSLSPVTTPVHSQKNSLRNRIKSFFEGSSNTTESERDNIPHSSRPTSPNSQDGSNNIQETNRGNENASPTQSKEEKSPDSSDSKREDGNDYLL